jgi:hypothetical protein
MKQLGWMLVGVAVLYGYLYVGALFGLVEHFH